MATDKPDLPDARIRDYLGDLYGLQVVEIVFIPSGDMNTTAYRVQTAGENRYFLKLRRGGFDKTSVMVPYFLAEHGVKRIIPPIPTRNRTLWARLKDFTGILYPFVNAHNAFELALTEQQWVEFGVALNSIHTTGVPPALSDRAPHESYSPQWRGRVKRLLERVRKTVFNDPIAAQLAPVVSGRAEEILYLVRRADQLSLVLQANKPENVLCHSDIHAGNLLIDESGSLYLVDWDNPILAPKERDLMFIGGGVGGIWHSAREETLFYQGYGLAPIDPVALAYYRFERIVQDIAEWGELLLFTDKGGKDRARSLKGFAGWFSPNGVVEMARKAEKALPPELRSKEL